MTWTVAAERNDAGVVTVTITNEGGDRAVGPFVVLSLPPTERRVIERVEPGGRGTLHLHELDEPVEQVTASLVDAADRVTEQKTASVS